MRRVSSAALQAAVSSFLIEMGLARSQAGEITAVLCRLAQDLTSGLELKALGAPSFHKLGTLGLSTQISSVPFYPSSLLSP